MLFTQLKKLRPGSDATPLGFTNLNLNPAKDILALQLITIVNRCHILTLGQGLIETVH